MEQKQDAELKNMSFRELELLKKKKLIESSLKQYEEDLKNVIKSNYNDLTSEEILTDWEKSKTITGMKLIVQEEIIKPTVIISDDKILHVLTSHYETVSNDNQIFRFAVKTFDKNVYSGTEWDKFDGRIDDVLINAKIKDSDGIIKQEFSGETQYGIYEDEQKIQKAFYPQGNYSLEIDITFNEQKSSQTLHFVIFESSDNSFNNPPIANAGSDEHLVSGSIVTLDGSNSTDQDDFVLYYTWKQIDGYDVKLSNDKIVNPTFIIPDIWDFFIFELIVDDGRKSSTSDIVEITSLHSDAGFNQTLSSFAINSTEIELDGFLSGNALGHSISYLWNVLIVPTESTIATGNLTDNSIENPKFIPDRFGNYTIQLEINDNEGLSDISNVTINVTP